MTSRKKAVRHSNLHVRLTASEKEAIIIKASDYGMSASSYMRFLAQLPISLLGTSDDKDATIVIDSTTWKKLLIESRRWGSNYNQGVRALNVIGARYGNPPRDAQRAEEVVRCAAEALQYLKNAKEGMEELLKIVEKLEDRVLLKADLPDSRQK